MQVPRKFIDNSKVRFLVPQWSERLRRRRKEIQEKGDRRRILWRPTAPQFLSRIYGWYCEQTRIASTDQVKTHDFVRIVFFEAPLLRVEMGLRRIWSSRLVRISLALMVALLVFRFINPIWLAGILTVIYVFIGLVLGVTLFESDQSDRRKVVHSELEVSISGNGMRWLTRLLYFFMPPLKLGYFLAGFCARHKRAIEKLKKVGEIIGYIYMVGLMLMLALLISLVIVAAVWSRSWVVSVPMGVISTALLWVAIRVGLYARLDRHPDSRWRVVQDGMQSVEQGAALAYHAVITGVGKIVPYGVRLPRRPEK